MPSLTFDAYLKSIQKNLQKGSERSHYPALKNLLDDPVQDIDAVIEEKGNKAGIPDFTVTRREMLVGYVEAKDVGLDLDQIEKTDQLKRYLEAFPNLVLTNYLEFRWYVDGKRRQKETLAERHDNKLQVTGAEKVAALLDQFLNYRGEIISSPEALAKQMARLTKAIRLATTTALELEATDGELHQLKQGFSEVLLPDLNDVDFADMYAQTISYGLFAARVGHAQNPGGELFTRRTAGTYIPATNPFLKRLFNTIVETDAVSQIDWAIDDLVQLLSQVEMGSILENFGRRTRQEDPVVHFYETFLAAYNAALRKSRGVYYTPEPVVSFIVRSVDAILKDRFDLPLGLADYSKDPVTKKPRVQILDPATGTGTFLYEVVKQIYRNLEEIGMAGQWDGYVRENLLGRLFGFELLMAPYAIAHLKLGLQLQELGYQFKGKQRLGIYLTNTLDEALKKSEILFGQFVAQEANEASTVKRDMPVMVVLGNPPYSVSSANKGAFIEGLMQSYKKAVRSERNIQPLSDDYIKFIRFAHHQIEQTGYGIVGFITNHSYLKGLIHRGVREELLKDFSQIYVLDLHGNSLLKETSPHQDSDQNVFDIQQGVSILIAVKEKLQKQGNNSSAKVFCSNLWGDRKTKYAFLATSSVDSIEWIECNPVKPNYFFAVTDLSFEAEYFKSWSIKDIFKYSSTGIETGKDSALVNFSVQSLETILSDLYDPSVSLDQLKERYEIEETSGWTVSKKRGDLTKSCFNPSKTQEYNYRPFDNRYIHFDNFLRRPHRELMIHLLQPNLTLMASRQQTEVGFRHIFVADKLSDCNALSLSSRERNYYFPVYLYPDINSDQGSLLIEKNSNLSLDFLKIIEEKLGYIPTPEAIFYYIYAIFHSPTYRQRYAEFLKIDFPRVPLTSSDQLFKDLGEKGQALVELHLMKSKKLNKLITKIGGGDDNAVTEVTYKPTEQRVYINKESYFEGIAPEVWTFKIGGYQVLDKWLKDRKKAKRTLSFDDVLHYQKVVVALKETMQLMAEIDALIPGFPIE